jgi:hypothetical protein
MANLLRTISQTQIQRVVPRMKSPLCFPGTWKEHNNKVQNIGLTKKYWNDMWYYLPPKYM